ncbi:MAG TPA: sugar phosphate isomerase/epimerase [Gemmatimonadaceae bacterium]|nr:sugar phosphate isomerase/epimerase [Gemmatimonadaceae bacterium]
MRPSPTHAVHPHPVRAAAALLAAVLAAAACRTTSPPAASGSPVADMAHEIRYSGDFRAPLGIQLWSFREQAKTDPVAMLRTVRRMGLTHVETAGMYGMTAAQFAEATRRAGLQVTSMHVGYDDLANHPETVIADAKTLGARYVGIAWYPHANSGFTEADARRAIADFNRFGRTLHDAGLTFFFHNHGYEAVRYGDGTLLDLMISETDPALVKYELDVLWAWLPGFDPAALIRKYPGRFRLMHIKDMKPGVARGSLSGGLPDDQQAAIGEGQVSWSDVMAAAARDGLEYYYIEDETPAPATNVPKSISWLERLRF